ncbi:DMT family transporter [Rhizobium sp. CG4]|jgi:drug/metabolite transporter (DMT)-like permease|uniref:DMT family transporter n=1 Tax=Rhizobium sp. CG4 TaxID=2726075 RepID=UPI0020331EC5|nr:DMT family transporter [Rhizobium sp. CG4]MCM2458521.1 DMT family transporter [Rhizobium sp. CG4]
MKPGAIAAYIFLAVAWGLSFLLMLRVVETFGWVGAVTTRCFIASLMLLLIAKLTGRKLNFGAGWRAFAIVGATTVAGQLVGLSYGTPLIGTAMAAIIVATIPLFSMLISQFWGLEKMTVQGLVGLLLGAGGIILLVGFPTVPVTLSFVLGCGACLVGCICAAFGSNYASRSLKGTGSWEITIGSFLAGGFITLPLLLAVPFRAIPGPVDFFYLFTLAMVMSALTYITYFWLVSKIGATKAISVEFAVTIIAVLIGALVLHEPLSVLQLGGAVVIITGCILVLGLFPRRKQPVPFMPET